MLLHPPAQSGLELPSPHWLRPLGLYAISGLAAQGDFGQSSAHLLAVDRLRGYLVRLDPRSQNVQLLNGLQAPQWSGVVGLAIDPVDPSTLWFAQGNRVLWWNQAPGSPPTPFVELPYEANGVALWGDALYVSSQKSGYIHVYHRTTAEPLDKFPLPGVGPANLTATATALWVCDAVEQTLYCLDRATGSLQFSALTPHPSPTAIAFLPRGAGLEGTDLEDLGPEDLDPEHPQHPDLRDGICYIAYADEEPYIRDDPNASFPYQLTFRDRTWVHPVSVYAPPQQPYTLSSGYLVEMCYVEELQPLDPIELDQVEWRIALPSNTLRQRVRQVEAIGHPCQIEEQEGQQVTKFQFDRLHPNQNGLFGWKVVMELYGLKYQITPDQAEDLGQGQPPFSQDFCQRYLVDNDELAMHTEILQRAAREAVGSETNVLRKMLKIRNYVYDHLSYGIQPRISTPDIALQRGVGSCGEYVGLLLALARLNGIACRTIGRYKCPPHGDRPFQPLEPDFNHVWLEFYLPGLGWVPMESNVDDVIERGPYPTRFFMGLAWHHVELGKGIKFETLKAANLPEKFSLRNLAMNHIRFRILEELSPQS
jgi:transglutaminase-like putative cysteine protease